MTSDSWRRLHILLLLAAMLCTSCASREERRSSELARRFDLVDVRTEIPGIAVDLRYASQDNVTRRAIYPAHMPCLLRRSTAEKLRVAQNHLRALGYGLCIWDAYRPPEAQQALLRHDGSSGLFLSPQSGWSRHCAGIAVDVTLVDAKGHQQPMPSSFDASLEQANPVYGGDDPRVKKNLEILQKAMQQAGFDPLDTEWWHFDDAEFVSNPQPIIYGWELGIPAP